MFDVRKACCLYGYRGSIAHNLYIPPKEPFGTDDRDFMGVCIAPMDCYIGIHQFDHKEYWEGSNDIVIYDIRKFVKLLIKANPNVLGFLWNKEEMWEEISPIGQILINNKSLFSTKQAYKSFVGYANSQLKKMKHMAYKGYMGDKRKRIVETFGYDTKNASHLIRLLRMGVEFLKDGKMNVYRTEDVDELIAIKQGKWALEKVQREAEILFQDARDAKEESSLPEYPDICAINDMLVGIFKQYWNIKKI